MAKLPSWSWLLVGLMIVWTSWYFEFELFFWIGWVFVIIGIAKFALGLLQRKEASPKNHQAHHAQYPTTYQHHLQHTQARLGHRAHYYHRCSCGNPVRLTDLFCSACGRRLR